MSGQMVPASGVALVTLTDAPGDFLSYQLAVVSLKLTRADGTAVETLPAPSKVEFAQLANLSEVISARQVSTGTYTGVSMTLDYSGATIVVDNGAGGLTVPAANIVNGATNGALISPNNQLTLTLKLSSNAPLVISDHGISSVALDFNLSASNTIAPASVTSSTSAVTVTVQPMLSASLAPDASKPVRVRGKLLSVDTSASSYTVNVRPFHDAMDDDHGRHRGSAERQLQCPGHLGRPASAGVRNLRHRLERQPHARCELGQCAAHADAALGSAHLEYERPGDCEAAIPCRA